MRPNWSNIAKQPIIRVQDVCVTRLTIWNSDSTLEEHLQTLPTLNCAWVFLEEQQSLTGVISVENIRNNQHHRDLAIRDLSLPITSTTLEQPLEQIVHSLSGSVPVAVVYNQGSPIGYIDQYAVKSVKHRAQLSNKSCQSLLSLPWVSEISKISTEIQTPVYLIGGCVRDWLLNQSNMDLDFAVEGDAITLAETLAREFGGVVTRFSNFGGAHWTVNELTIDLTMCRHEIYPSFGSLPEVYPSHISDDLRRRDFAINAMAISIFQPTLGLLIDPFDGRGDIDSQQLQILHSLSWLEDPTRLFRASRYSARLNFTLEQHALSSLKTCLDTITPGVELTFSRIGIELNKMLNEPNINLCFQRLKSWGIIQSWFPFWENIEFPQTCDLSYTPSRHEVQELWWMILALAIPRDIREQYTSLIGIRADALKLISVLQQDLPKIVLGLSDISTENPDFEVDVGTILQGSTPLHWMISVHLRSDIAFLVEWWVSTGRHRQRQTTGEDILGMGIPKGPLVGELLKTAQIVAWQGGDHNLELLEVRKKWNHLKQNSNDE